MTDVNGCEASDCFTVNASDVRCIAGNSSNQKIKVCHHTNSNKNPWVDICIDTSALQAHLLHGDYIGSCSQNKSQGAGYIANDEEGEDGMYFSIYPNPAEDKVTLEFNSEAVLPYAVEICDLTGQKVVIYNNNSTPGINLKELNLKSVSPGIYIVSFTLDENKILKKLIIK